MADARFVCRIGIVDDVRDQAELSARRLIGALNSRRGHGERSGLGGVSYCVSVIAPDDDAIDGDLFWSETVAELSGIATEPPPTIWSDGATEADKKVPPAGYHAIISDLFFDQLKWSSDPRDGLDLLKFSRSRHPEIFTGLITVATPEELDEIDRKHVKWVISKDSLREDRSYKLLCKSIDESIRQRLSSPFWEGLQVYADGSKLILHAMAAADGQSLSNSLTTFDYKEFFGDDYFEAEASLTLEPLDSLLSPSGRLQLSQELYAQAFGADFARFSTNGTSASNSIVGQALCSSGDYILLDQNCHISHHYSYARSGVTPVFLEAEHVSDVDEYSSVHPKTLFEAVSKAIASQSAQSVAQLPKLIVLTNCTFDGVAVRPDAYLKAVSDALDKHGLLPRLNEICFLFDEAWWGFARFDPRLIEFTAMYQVARLRRTDPSVYSGVRVYATHSTHKTLSSFRQTSAILVSDPEYHGPEGSELKFRFEQSFLAHTTTSPHAGMLASFDVARRQALLDGSRIISASSQMAVKFKDWLRGETKSASRVGGMFRVVEDEELLGSLGDVAIVDPTKITVEILGGMSGPEFKRKFWEQPYRVQFNKYGRRRSLLMFTIGFDVEELEQLKNKLISFAETYFQPEETRIEVEYQNIRRTDFSVVCSDGVIDDFPKALGSSRSWEPGTFLFSERVGDLQSKIMSLGDIKGAISLGELVVAGSFVTPYPPGFPVIYPGQVIDKEALSLIPDYPNVEIHGEQKLNGENHLRVFIQST